MLNVSVLTANGNEKPFICIGIGEPENEAST